MKSSLEKRDKCHLKTEVCNANSKIEDYVFEKAVLIYTYLYMDVCIYDLFVCYFAPNKPFFIYIMAVI